jgi:hypothetical protein
MPRPKPESIGPLSSRPHPVSDNAYFGRRTRGALRHRERAAIRPAGCDLDRSIVVLRCTDRLIGAFPSCRTRNNAERRSEPSPWMPPLCRNKDPIQPPGLERHLQHPLSSRSRSSHINAPSPSPAQLDRIAPPELQSSSPGVQIAIVGLMGCALCTGKCTPSPRRCIRPRRHTGSAT